MEERVYGMGTCLGIQAATDYRTTGREGAMIAYFGCWGDTGHYLWMPGKHRPSRPEEESLPRAGALDGSIMFLPQPEQVGTGAITYLPAPNLTVLAWWGNPWDKRGAVNSAVIVTGNVPRLEVLWGAFEKAFPDLASQLERPVLSGDKNA